MKNRKRNHDVLGDPDDAAPSKAQKKQLHHFIEQIKLTDEQEDRLGKKSTASQWLIRIAQSKGANTCLVIRTIIKSVVNEECEEWTLHIETADRQLLTLVFRGKWIFEASRFLHCEGKVVEDHPILLSGLGACLQGTSDKVTFLDGALALHIIDVSFVEDLRTERWLRPGWLEILGGKVAWQAIPCRKGTEARGPERTVIDLCADSHEERPTPVAPSVNARSTSDMGPPLMQRALETPILSHRVRSSDDTPDWLHSPAPSSRRGTMTTIDSPLSVRKSAALSYQVNHDLNTNPRSDITNLTNKSQVALRRKMYQRPYQLAGETFCPVTLLEQDASKPTATFKALCIVVSRDEPRRSSGGDRDLSVKLGVQDFYSAPNDHRGPLTFMMFGPTEKDIPIHCRPGDLIAIIGFVMQSFNGARQALGGSRKFQWVTCDRQTGEVKTSQNTSTHSPITKAAGDRLSEELSHLQNENGSKSVDAPTVRQITEIRNVEIGRFFDANVEIRRVWDGRFPTLLVTDYSSHPKLYFANDVDLGVYSREELQRRSDANNETGFGRTMQVTLWDEQTQAIGQVEEGMLVRLENVRPKLSPGGYLEGSMGSGGCVDAEPRLRVCLLGEDDAVALQEKRARYFEEVALERCEGETITVERTPSMSNFAEIDHNISENVSRAQSHSLPISYDSRSSFSMPLSEIQVRSMTEEDANPRMASFYKRPTACVAGRSSFVELDESVLALPVTHFNDVIHLSLDNVGDKHIFRCRILLTGDARPERLREWVSVECRSCNRRLAPGQAMCVSCSEMDSKDLTYSFRIGLLAMDASNVDPILPINVGRGNDQYALALSNLEAFNFFHHFHPRDIRDREKSQLRLARRLSPLLGAKAAHRLLLPNGLSSDEHSTNAIRFDEFQERVPPHQRNAMAVDVGIACTRIELDGSQKPQHRNRLSIVSSRLLRCAQDEQP